MFGHQRTVVQRNLENFLAGGVIHVVAHHNRLSAVSRKRIFPFHRNLVFGHGQRQIHNRLVFGILVHLPPIGVCVRRFGRRRHRLVRHTGQRTFGGVGQGSERPAVHAAVGEFAGRRAPVGIRKFFRQGVLYLIRPISVGVPARPPQGVGIRTRPIVVVIRSGCHNAVDRLVRRRLALSGSI